jgi:pyruvate-formate lyase
MPLYADEDPNNARYKIGKRLLGVYGEGTDALTEGAPFDINILEDYPEEVLEWIIRGFAAGLGTNLMTITCNNPKTFDLARTKPEMFDLVRVRMGGWTEFFVSMFPAH